VIGRGLRDWTVAALACLLMVTLHAWTPERPEATGTRVRIGQVSGIYGSTMVVNSFTIGQVLYLDDRFQSRTGVLYLAINVTIASPKGGASILWDVSGRSGTRTFATGTQVRVPQPGFTKTMDVIFELDGADLPGFQLVVLDRELIYAHDRQVTVDLDLDARKAADLVARDRFAVVKASDGTDEVIR
jgi:hypothetical protein